MLVNKEKKLIFVRIPKTACTSISVALSRCGWKEIHTLTDRKFAYHLPSDILKDYPIFDDFKIIGVSRNPWDRILSLYTFYIKRTNQIINGEVGNWSSDPSSDLKWAIRLNKKVTRWGFDKWVLEAKNDPDFSRPTQPISIWLNEDHPGGFEWFRFDRLDEMQGVLGFTIEHLNDSPHLHYSEYYGERAKWLVGKIHEAEIEKFGYIFGE
jgi:hypothetical protein